MFGHIFTIKNQPFKFVHKLPVSQVGTWLRPSSSRFVPPKMVFKEKLRLRPLPGQCRDPRRACISSDEAEDEAPQFMRAAAVKAQHPRELVRFEKTPIRMIDQDDAVDDEDSVTFSQEQDGMLKRKRAGSKLHTLFLSTPR